MRWLARITYFTEAGESVKLHPMEELGELEELVERGPSFYAIKDIGIVYNTMGEPHKTVELAERE